MKSSRQSLPLEFFKKIKEKDNLCPSLKDIYEAFSPIGEATQ